MKVAKCSGANLCPVTGLLFREYELSPFLTLPDMSKDFVEMLSIYSIIIIITYKTMLVVLSAGHFG